VGGLEKPGALARPKAVDLTQHRRLLSIGGLLNQSKLADMAQTGGDVQEPARPAVCSMIMNQYDNPAPDEQLQNIG
jgi:hypothetical protein